MSLIPRALADDMLLKGVPGGKGADIAIWSKATLVMMGAIGATASVVKCVVMSTCKQARNSFSNKTCGPKRMRRKVRVDMRGLGSHLSTGAML
eukprot:9848452-Alexandrium_andersonii.AAC.1